MSHRHAPRRPSAQAFFRADAYSASSTPVLPPRGGAAQQPHRGRRARRGAPRVGFGQIEIGERQVHAGSVRPGGGRPTLPARPSSTTVPRSPARAAPPLPPDAPRGPRPRRSLEGSSPTLIASAVAQENPAPGEPGQAEAVQPPENDRDELLRLMREFADTFEQIERNYVAEVSREELIEAAIDGMVARLDPYSAYLDDDEVAVFRPGRAGANSSASACRSCPAGDTGRLTVAAPLPGTPAAEAGVRAGDVIAQVDGESVDGLSTAEVTARIKGPRR